MKAIVGSIDIYPTILELCKMDVPYDLDGKSFKYLINQPEIKQENYETVNIALESPKVADKLMPLLEKGNTGLYK